MNLLETLLNAQGGGLVEQLARNFNLDKGQADSALKQLVPALTRGVAKNVQQPGGLQDLLGALQKGNHSRYVDNPADLVSAETVKDGNGILGHIFGSKDVSRQVASRAAQNTGIDVGILKKMLPMVAAATMGGMSKQQQGGGALAGMRPETIGREPPKEAIGGLGKLLDADGDGSIADDLFGIAKKFF